MGKNIKFKTKQRGLVARDGYIISLEIPHPRYPDKTISFESAQHYKIETDKKIIDQIVLELNRSIKISPIP